MTSSYFNEWLDEYNDYMRLYLLFGDEGYRVQAEEALSTLKEMAATAARHRSIVWRVMSDTIHAY
ncbi:hypothetical protein BK133_30185 [Paenibacillus sp. FSL H8-0548]|uniref:hypothetical protein n=1 Tax=Paenibacillus sp. FSL H8-0548 TaxID=1920422 RepID=UPI00096D66D7|nr:hypothetical protein [Paenibacillus sp. FSL H8-0548]OMF18886.1 hypothetical protein BK133_30185 [Paenibacillus sp. FSL H8-0548]